MGDILLRKLGYRSDKIDFYFSENADLGHFFNFLTPFSTPHHFGRPAWSAMDEKQTTTGNHAPNGKEYDPEREPSHM